jgi:hypothetical protein
MDELTIMIVGIDFPNADKSRSNRRMEIMMCHRGDRVELRREPRNAFDGNAVGVWSERGVQLGYVGAERAPLISKRMQHDDTVAIFQGLQGGAAYIRIRFGGGAPTLPLVSTAPTRNAASPPDIYPDDDGPEWGA